MNPLDDTLNVGATLPRSRQDCPKASAPAGDDLESMQTIRLPGVGSIVFNRYRLQRVLGRGGMGVVWLAEDTKLDRAVALKFLPDIVGADPSALQELAEETRRGLELAHPNIVRIHDLVSDDRSAAISMEYVDGKNLAEQRLSRPDGVYSVDAVAAWLGHLCGALDYAHLQKRIVHRDLKPANLMLDAEHALKITDFGIARSINDAVSRLSRAGLVSNSGTLPYMSPQQVMGELPRPTDDVYSIGATLYELFTGKPPFHSGDIGLQITSKTAPPIRQRREELAIGADDSIPQEWEDAVAACLEKEPSRRPQTAGALAQRLGLGFPCTEPTPPPKAKTSSLRPIEIGARSTEAKRKTPVLAIVLGLLAALVLLAAAGTGALWWWFHRAGSWVVQTEPAGAHVSVDGQSCVSPATLNDLKPGMHTASITLDGYEPREVEFDVPPGRRVDFGTVTLERITGQLLLSSDPDGTTYELAPADGGAGERQSGRTPDTLRLPPGRYSVAMAHGGVRKTAEVVIVRNATVRQGITFDKPGPPPQQAPLVASTTTPATGPQMTQGANASQDAVTLAITPTLGPQDPAAQAGTPPSPANLPPGTEPMVTVRAFPNTPTVTEAPVQGSSAAAGTLAPASPGAQPQPGPQPPPGNAPATPPGTAPSPVTPPANTKGQEATSSSSAAAFLTGGGAPQGPMPPPSSGPENPGAAGPLGAAPASGVAPQPVVQAPAAGYWKIDEILGNSEYSGYSAAGRSYLVYKAQQAMKESADGVPGKGTYKAIQKFQTENGLQPTGQLDSATLAAMNLNGQPDRADWDRPGRVDRDDGRTPESEKTKFRKMIERNVLGGRDLKDIFRR